MGVVATEERAVGVEAPPPNGWRRLAEEVAALLPSIYGGWSVRELEGFDDRFEVTNGAGLRFAVGSDRYFGRRGRIAVTLSPGEDAPQGVREPRRTVGRKRPAREVAAEIENFFLPQLAAYLEEAAARRAEIDEARRRAVATVERLLAASGGLVVVRSATREYDRVEFAAGLPAGFALSGQMFPASDWTSLHLHNLDAEEAEAVVRALAEVHASRRARETGVDPDRSPQEDGV